MAVERKVRPSPNTLERGRYMRGTRYEVSAEEAGTFGEGEYHEVILARVDGAFASGGAEDANEVNVEHSWDGESWASAGVAEVTGNGAAQAVVGDLRPHVRFVVTTPGAATFTGTVDLL